MCLNRLNISAILCDRIENGNNLIGVFDRVEPLYENGRPLLSMSLFIKIVAVFPRYDNSDEKNTIKRDSTYEVIVRLIHIQSGTGIDIGAFEFSTAKTIKLCREVVEYNKVLDIHNKVLPNGTGKYGIKIFVKEKGTDVWSLQTVQSFNVL